MPVPVRLFLVSLTLLLGACAGTQMQREQGPPFVLDVHNPMPHPMNVSYSVGGVVANLGTVQANATARFEIPNRGGDEITLIATDAGNTHRVQKSVNLERERPVRVELSTVP